VSSSSTVKARRFEFTEGNYSRFWEIMLRGSDVMVRYGRIGSNGQAQLKSFADEQAAVLHVEKMIREKTKKGYRETA